MVRMVVGVLLVAVTVGACGGQAADVVDGPTASAPTPTQAITTPPPTPTPTTTSPATPRPTPTSEPTPTVMSPSAIANAIEGVVFDQSLCDLILPSQDVARFMGGASAPTVDVDQILEWTRCEWHVEVPQVRNLQVIVTPQVAPEFRLEYEQRLLDGSYVPVDGVGVGAARALEGANHEVYVTDDLHLVVMPVGLAAEAAGELVRVVTANLRGLLAAEVLPPEGATLSPAPQGLALATEELCPVVAPAFIVTETFGSTATDTSAEVHIDLVSPVVHCVYYLESGDRLILTVSFNQDGADRRWFEATMAAEGREPVAGLGVLAGVAPASYVVFVSDTVRLDVNAGPGEVAAALDQLVPAMVANLQAALG